MLINSDLTLPALVRFSEKSWIESPQPGVARLLLERDGGEVARATSIVRYAPNARFPTHVHDLGEEYLVLEGVFSDETGGGPAGTYVRNPPGSSHTPYSVGGCTIFVKLRQMAPRADRERIVRHIDQRRGQQILFESASEIVEVQRIGPGDPARMRAGAGRIEMLVLDGEASHARHGALFKWDWLREPPSDGVTSQSGAVLWLKSTLT